MSETVVCALYHFARFPDFERWQAPLLDLMESGHVRGTLLLAAEGVNGTIAGPRPGVEAILAKLKSDDRFAAMEWKESYADDRPFPRARVKLKQEIVTMGVPDVDPEKIVGTYVAPEDWNNLISDPDVVLVDTRNEYEVNIGTFKGAVNPHTTTFREFPAYAKENLDPARHKKVAMFCTGGIRCEKSTAFLKSSGFDEVYHLKGGILKYLESVPEQDSLWEGECFVFDDRVTVNHQLEPGNYDQCHACRMPISDEDKSHSAYVKGVSCHHCIDQQSDEQRARFRERERQVELAKARGEAHIGADAKTAQALHKQQKQARRKAHSDAARKNS